MGQLRKLSEICFCDKIGKIPKSTVLWNRHRHKHLKQKAVEENLDL